MKYEFVDFLLSKGLLNEFTAERIEAEAEETKIGPVALISRFANISDTRLAREVAQFYNLPRFNYNRFDVDKVATELVSGIVSVRLGVLPYRFGSNGDLHVVCRDPSLVEGIVHDLEKVIPGSVKLEVGPTRAIRELAAFVHYGRSFSNDFDCIVSTSSSDARDFTGSSAAIPPLHKEEKGSRKRSSAPPPPPPPQTGDFQQRPSVSSHPALDKIVPSEGNGAHSPDRISEVELNEEEVSVDVVIEQQLAHLAELHEESLPMEWEDEDTVVRQRNSRDESLKDFYLHNTRIYNGRERLDPKRRQLIGLQTPYNAPPPDPFSDLEEIDLGLDPISEGELELEVGEPSSGYLRSGHSDDITGTSQEALPSYPSAGTSFFGRRSPDSETPSHHLESGEDPSFLMIQLVQHEARIEQLESDIVKVGETLDLLVSCIEKFGIDLSAFKKPRE